MKENFIRLGVLNGQTVLAVIPARSGSKRCPNKNFREFRGKKLYIWALHQALESKLVDLVFVSLDIDRPKSLCTDEATNEDVLRYHLVDMPHDWVVLLQPTSPLRTAEDIDECIRRAVTLAQPIVSYRPDGTKNGAVYVASSEWLKTHNFDAPHMKYEMPNERSLDIDYPEQFE